MSWGWWLAAAAGGLFVGRAVGMRSLVLRTAEDLPSDGAVSSDASFVADQQEEEGLFFALTGAVEETFDRFFDAPDASADCGCSR